MTYNGHSTIAGDMVYHISTAVQLMRAALDHQLVDKEILTLMINDMMRKSDCVREEALWDSFGNFLDSSLDKFIEERALEGTDV